MRHSVRPPGVWMSLAISISSLIVMPSVACRHSQSELVLPLRATQGGLPLVFDRINTTLHAVYFRSSTARL